MDVFEAGKRGGKARAKKLSKEQRSESARRAARARWGDKVYLDKVRYERVLDLFIQAFGGDEGEDDDNQITARDAAEYEMGSLGIRLRPTAVRRQQRLDGPHPRVKPK